MTLHSCVLFCGGVLILFSHSTSTVDSSSFCYEDDNRACGPSNWPQTCQTGQNQSPIDIPLSSLPPGIAVKTNFFMSQSYFQDYTFTLKNTGHTARLELARNEKSKLILGGALFNNKNYTFAHVDFHWGLYDSDGSEHSLSGKRYAMEAQFVHYLWYFDNVTQAVASQEPHAVAIIVVLFEISTDDNLGLSNITRSLAKIKEAGQTTSISDVTFPYVMDSQKNTLVSQYFGSLTTPDCSESVIWNVLSGYQPISSAQLHEFRSLNDNEGKHLGRNNRPLQRDTSIRIRYFHPVIRDDVQ